VIPLGIGLGSRECKKKRPCAPNGKEGRLAMWDLVTAGIQLLENTSSVFQIEGSGNKARERGMAVRP